MTKKAANTRAGIPDPLPFIAERGKIARGRLATPLQRLRAAGPLRPLANSAPDAADTPFVGLGNEIDLATGDGWALLSSYGEWPHAEGLQRFGKPEAERMVSYFKNGWNRIKRAVVGMPIFRGHPDLADQVKKQLANARSPSERAAIQAQLAALANQFPDRTVYGSIADLEARDDGLWFKPVLTEDGADQVTKQGAKFVSPHWLANELPMEAGRRVFAPIYLVSVGLTPRPNIPGPSLINSLPDFPAMNRTLVLQLLARMGRPLANEATDDQINTELTAAGPLVQALLARPEATALANEQGRVTELNGKLTAAETALANERSAHAATAKARNEMLVAAAVKEGRVTEAARPVWLGRLARDFATESVALANETTVVKTKPVTEGLGNRKPANAAGSEFTALVNEAMPKHGNNWNVAWAAVKATPKGQELIRQMDEAAAATA